MKEGEKEVPDAVSLKHSYSGGLGKEGAEFLRFWFYWNTTRDAEFNAWQLNSRNAGAQMPGLVARTGAVFNLTEYAHRFPVDESHSQTPDGSPRTDPNRKQIPQKPGSNKKKRRPKKKGGAAADEESET